MPIKFSIQSPKVVLPSKGHLPLNCPFCQGRAFKIHVEPTKNPSIAAIRAVICATPKCQKVLPVERGLLGGKATIDTE